MKNKSEVNHWYIWTHDLQSRITYERTCGDEDSAKKRCDELRKRNIQATYTKNEIHKEFYY